MSNEPSERNHYALPLRRKGVRRPTKRPFKFPSPKKSRKTSPVKKHKKIENNHEDEQKELLQNSVPLPSTSSTGIGTDIPTSNNNNNATEKTPSLKLTELRNEEEELINNQKELLLNPAPLPSTSSSGIGTDILTSNNNNNTAEKTPSLELTELRNEEEELINNQKELPLNPAPLLSASSSGIGKGILISNKNNKAAKRTPSFNLLEKEKLFNNQKIKKNGLLQHNFDVSKAKENNRLSFKSDSSVHHAKKMRKKNFVEEKCVTNDKFVSQTMTVNTILDSDLSTKIGNDREDNFELVLWARDEEINFDQVTDLDIALHYMNVIIENHKLKDGGKNEKCIRQFQKILNNKFRGVISQHQRKRKPLTKDEKLVREWNDHVELLRHSDAENDRLKYELVQINNKIETAIERRRKLELCNSFLCQWDNLHKNLKETCS